MDEDDELLDDVNKGPEKEQGEKKGLGERKDDFNNFRDKIGMNKKDIQQGMRQGAQRRAAKAGKKAAGKAGKAGKAAAKAGKAAAKAGKAAAGAGKTLGIFAKLFATPVGWVILGIILVIIIGLMIAGIVNFFSSMPGMFLDKVIEFGNNLWKNIVSTTTGNTHVSKEEELELAAYIEELGYDIDGFGFGNTIRKKDEEGNLTIKEIQYNDDAEKDDNENIRLAHKNYLEQYIIANDSTYAKTHYSFAGALLNPNDKSKWSNGMLVFHTKPGETNREDNVIVDRDNKKMIVYEQAWGLNDIPITGFRFLGELLGDIKWGDTYEFSMDGWTGRYGKPLELSLALHLSTMAPDLVYEIATNPVFDTKIHLSTQQTKYNATAKYVADDGKTLTQSELKSMYDQLDGKGNLYETNEKRSVQLKQVELSFEQESIKASKRAGNEGGILQAYIPKDSKSFEISIDLVSSFAKVSDVGYKYVTRSGKQYVSASSFSLVNGTYVAKFDEAPRSVKAQITYYIRVKSSQGQVFEYTLYFLETEDGKTLASIYEEQDSSLKDITAVQPEDTGETEAPTEEEEEEIDTHGLTYEQIGALIEYMEDIKETTTYAPYIIAVEKSWYYGLIMFSYDLIEAGEHTTYVEPEDYPKDLKDVELGGKIEYTSKADGESAYQTGEPLITEEPNKAIIALFQGNASGKTEYRDRKSDMTDTEQAKIDEIKSTFPSMNENLDEQDFYFTGEYYIYDGTRDTAQRIAEAKAIDLAEKFEVDYKTQEVRYLWGGEEKVAKDKSVKKRSVSFDNYTQAFQAFSILEGMHTLDSELIYRNLQELLIEMEYFKKEDFEDKETNVLEWFIPSYTPKIWPTQEENQYGAVLKSKTNLTKGQSNEQIEDRKYKLGFDTGEAVISPGMCEVVEIGDKVIKIKFTEPDVVKDLTMIIMGVDFDTSLKVGDKLEKGQEIGLTTDDDISVMLKDTKNSVIDNIADYMRPNYNDDIAASTSDLAYYHWVPYESGSLKDGIKRTGFISGPNEFAAGIAQWTIIGGEGGFNNVSELSSYLVQANPSFCAPLKAFIGQNGSQGIASASQITAAFESLSSTEGSAEKFRALQMEFYEQQTNQRIESKGVQWIQTRSTALKGAYSSLLNWGPGLSYTLNESSSDADNVRSIFKSATGYSSTVGSLNTRWTSQYVFARDIIEGRVSEEELQSIIFEGNGLGKYAQGANPGALN